MPMPTGNGENPQFYGQWTVQDSQNGLCTKKFTKTKNSISLDSRFVDLENTGERATLSKPAIGTNFQVASKQQEDKLRLTIDMKGESDPTKEFNHCM